MSLEGVRECRFCGGPAVWVPREGGAAWGARIPYWGAPDGRPWCHGPGNRSWPDRVQTHAPVAHIPYRMPLPPGRWCLCDAWGTHHRHLD